MRALQTVLVVLFFSASLLSVPAPALAKGPNAKAQRFEKLGKKAYGRKDWDEAIAAFEAAYQADPVPKFLYNAARAYEKKDDHRKAIEFLERYLSKVSDPKEREDAEVRLDMLQIKLRKSRSPIRIQAPAGAIILMKGPEDSAQGEGVLSTWLPFGAYELKVSLDGHKDDSRTVLVKADGNLKLKIELEKIEESPPAAAAASAKPKGDDGKGKETAKKDPPKEAKVAKEPKAAKPQEESKEAAAGASGPGWPAYAALGIGALAIVGGVVAGTFVSEAEANIETLKQRSAAGDSVDYNAELKPQIDSRDNNALMANVLFGVGAVAVVGGGVLWLMAPTDAVATPAPFAVRGGGGLTFSGRF